MAFEPARELFTLAVDSCFVANKLRFGKESSVTNVAAEKK